MAVYLLQVIALGLAGSLLGILLARATLAAIPVALGSSTSILAEADYGLTWSAAAQGIAIGVLVSLLFSLVPLMQVRYVKPSLLLRDEAPPRARDWTQAAVLALVSVGLVAVAGWQAGSLRVGIVVSVGFAALAVALQLAGRLLIALMAPLAESPSFPLRHAVLHLSRPGNQTRVILLRGRARGVLRGRRAIAAGEPARGVLGPDRAGRARHVPDRHPAGAGRRRARLSGRPGERRRSIAAHSGPAGPHHGGQGPHDEPRVVRGRAGARLAGARVHDYLSRRPRVERAHRAGHVPVGSVAGSGGLGRAGHPRAVLDQPRRHDPVRRRRDA